MILNIAVRGVFDFKLNAIIDSGNVSRILTIFCIVVFVFIQLDSTVYSTLMSVEMSAIVFM